MLLLYKAMNEEGHVVSGRIEATSKDALMASLRKQNLRPLTINSIKKKRSGVLGTSKKVKLSELVIFTRQLATMVGAGVPLTRSLSSLQNNADGPYLKEVLLSVTKDVESGHPLGDAFAKYPKVFSDVYVNMVRAGEDGGILDDILKRLALQVEQDASIRKKIKSAMMYPIVILVITVIAFFGIMLFILPKITVLFTELGGPNAKLPIYARALLDISSFCIHPTIINKIPGISGIVGINKVPNLIFLAILGGIIVVLILRYIKTPTGKYRFHALLLRLPVIKVVVLKIAIARFARTFAALMGAGVSVLDALQVTGQAIGNKVIEAELKAAANEVRNGKPLSEPLSISPHFPGIVSQMLLVGEETGQIDTVLVKVADFYDEEVTVLIDGLAALIEPIMIVGLGAAVGLLAASVMGPIADLSKQVTPNS